MKEEEEECHLAITQTNLCKFMQMYANLCKCMQMRRRWGRADEQCDVLRLMAT